MDNLGHFPKQESVMSELSTRENLLGFRFGIPGYQVPKPLLKVNGGGKFNKEKKRFFADYILD
jgi:hypothetical protein